MCEERFQEWNDVDGSSSAQRGGGRMLGQRNQVSKVEREVGSDPHTTYARSALRRVRVWYIYIYIYSYM
jgi:hypothetical protein